MNVKVDISDTVIRTDRLLLRPWRQTDLDDFFEYASVPGVGEMAGWPHHKNKEESAEILKRFIDHKRTFALELGGKTIGSLGIEEYDESVFPELAPLRCREIGYVLSKDYWGRGLMAEAVKEAVRYCFEELSLDAVLCGHYDWNTQSGRVQEKCGFRHYKSGDRPSKLGKMEHHEYNIITAAEYKMGLKSLRTGSVSYLEALDGGSLYWGTDYASGDLYEAEEIFKNRRDIKSNRLVFVSLKEGKVFEPLKAEEGQYFGKPVFYEGRAWGLLADFAARWVRVLRFAADFSGAETAAELSLDDIPDCYNLLLDTSPLVLTRQGPNKRFDVLWPEKGSFEVGNTETFDFRDGNILVFSRWFEDPEYREDTVLRSYPDGALIETLNGPVLKGADGGNWLLWQDYTDKQKAL